MFELTDSPIVLWSSDDPKSGAEVVFVGKVRDHNDGREVLRLEYEAMEPLATKEGSRILEEAMRQFAVTAIHCVHRVGQLQIGEVAVQVTATAAHRAAAFDACRYVIEEVKQRVPIWKKEFYGDGSVEWVNAAERAEQHGPAVLIDCAEELAGWTLIDVREDEERETAPIEGFALLVSPKKSFDRRLLEHPKPLLVCARGVSALLLADDLRREGFLEVWSLTGGCETLKQIARKSK